MVSGRLTIMLLLLMITLSTFYLSLGGEYCSNSSTDVHCIACVECHARYNTCFACPVDCEEKCSFICNARCQNDTCAYNIDGILKCTDGCVLGATGIFCKEICPRGCKDLLCDQLNSKCNSCEDGLTGDYCNETLSTTTASITSVLSTTGPITSVLFTDSTVVSETAASTICLPSCMHCVDSEKDTQCCKEDGSSCAYLIISVAIPTSVFILAIVAIGLACRRRRRGKQTVERDVSSVDDHSDERMIPPLPVLVEISSEDSGPYAFIKVVDRDCVPDHIYQAAMVTAPYIDPDTLSNHICQTPIGTFPQRM